MNLQIFEHEEFGVIRTVEVDGEIYFVMADVCRALGLEPAFEIARLDGDERAKFDLGASYGEVACVDEVGLYKLFRTSTKPNAINFHRWICIMKKITANLPRILILLLRSVRR